MDKVRGKETSSFAQFPGLPSSCSDSLILATLTIRLKNDAEGVLRINPSLSK
jgi:hypothetical protein